MRSISMQGAKRSSTRGIARHWRGLAQPQLRPDAYLPGSSTIYGQFWLGQSLWRPSALWAAIAGLFASGVLNQLDALNWQAMALLCLLVDLLWGAIWRLSGGRDQLLPLRSQPGTVAVRLPYMQADSPAAQLFRWNSADVWPWLLRVALPTVAIALLVAASMGEMALLLTVLVALFTAAGWVMRRNFNQPPALWQALVTIALPWFLALWRNNLIAENELWLVHLALLSLWTLHHWGEGRVICLQSDWLGIALLAIADCGLLVFMVSQRLPIGVALLAILMLPTWFAIVRRGAVQGIVFWWWAAMLLSAQMVSQI